MLTVIWKGKRYSGNEFEEVKEAYLEDPLSDSWEAMLSRVNSGYGLALRPEHPASEVFAALYGVGEIESIIKE